MIISEILKKLGKESIENQKWLDSLPEVVEKVVGEWNLDLGSVFT